MTLRRGFALVFGACLIASLPAAASHMVTGNGFGFAVVSPETGAVSKFYAHPYCYTRHDPNNPLSEGVETANFIKELVWRGAGASSSSNGIRGRFASHPPARKQRRGWVLHAFWPASRRSGDRLGAPRRRSASGRMACGMEPAYQVAAIGEDLRRRSDAVEVRRDSRVSSNHSAGSKAIDAATASGSYGWSSVDACLDRKR